MSNEVDLKLIAAAASRLERQKLAECYDSRDLDSRPSPRQLELLKDIGKISVRYLISSNQCLVKGTMVATPEGPKCIEEIKVGDTVFSEYGTPIKVKATYDTGIQEVGDLTGRNKTFAACTANHVWQVAEKSNYRGKITGRILEIPSQYLTKYSPVRTVRAVAPLGNVHDNHAYVIGALLGDGCSREPSKTSIIISSGNDLIPNKVAGLLGCSVRKLSLNNHSWKLSASTCSHYEQWCRGRYAHEKIVDMTTIKSWDRETLLQFVAGVFDTEGSVTATSIQIALRVGMQAKIVVESLQYACLALWNIQAPLIIDDRVKYKNGPVYYLSVGNPYEAKRMLKELDRHLVSPQKKWREEYQGLAGKRCSEDYLTLAWGSNRRLEQTYDIHVDSPTNLYLLANGLVTHNSGKTSAGVREMAWILNANHPWWKRPDKWGEGPLFFIIAGQNRTNIEEEIWKRKLRPLLIDREDWKEKKAGGIVTSVRNEKNGNTILFLVHGQGTEETRAALQGYRAHYILFDEMPKEFSTFTEIQMRTDAYDGYILVAFTPLLKNLAMKNAVENAQVPYAKKYVWTVWDNPMNCTSEKKLQIEQRAASWSESERQTRLYGGWSADDNAVYHFNLEQMTCYLPESYNRNWRHVESTDPATSGTTGITIWAEDPSTYTWYCVLAEYIKGDANRAPSRTVQEVYGKTLNYNIVRRISDTMPWYVAAAREFNLTYLQPWNKVQRKDELIKNLQEAMSSGKIKIAKHCTLLIEEFMTCRWKEDSENKIVAHQRYHLLDSAQYFWDIKPKAEAVKLPASRDQWIAQEWEKVQKKEAAKAKAKEKMRTLIQRKRRWR